MKTTSTRPVAADLIPPARQKRQYSARSVTDRRGAWRLALDSAWQHKIDEIITLSMASSGLTSDADDGLAEQALQGSSRLHARTERAYHEVAAIEEAIARIDAGTYGMCAGCGRTMSDEWLAEKPEAQDCPDCSLHLVQVSAG